MILRNRFNLAFAAIFGTAQAAILLVFIEANSYARQVDDSNKKNQWAVVVERLRFAIVQKQLELETAGQADAGLLASLRDLPGIGGWWQGWLWGHEQALALSIAQNGVRELLDSISITLERLPIHDGSGELTAPTHDYLTPVRESLARVRLTGFEDGEAVHRLSTDLQAIAFLLQSRSVNAQREATEIGFAVVSLAAYSCVFLVVEFGVFWILVRSWTIHPIMSLAGDARKLHEASPDFRLTVNRTDEIGQLAESLNDMMARLRDRERQLARARELATVGEICSGVAHGMRNPLAVIRLSAQRFAQSVTMSPEQQAMVDDIVVQVDRLNERITRLLRFASSLNPRIEEVSFDWLSSVAVRESMAAVSQHDLRIEVHDETHGVPCLMDPDLTVQAVVECISNSTHHSPAGSTITLRGSLASAVNGHGPEWRVSITDRGRGIRPEVLGNIFDLFFSMRENGTGVGLSMVKRIVEQHNGHIDVESKPGESTTFHLCWPLKTRPDEPAAMYT